MAEEKKRLHLKDLIAPGREFAIRVVDGSGQQTEATIFVHKPTAGQQQEAYGKARAASARAKAPFRDESSDEYIALRGQLDDASFEDLVDMMLSFRGEELRTQAREEVLHDEEVGSNWGDDGEDYFSTVDAIASRMNQIDSLNEEREPSSQIDPLEDEEIKTLTQVTDKFMSEVSDRYEKLRAIETNRMKMSMTTDKLRDELFKKLVELEANMAWYQEYQLWMLYFACRDPENKKKLYFDSLDELLDVPDYVMSQLWDANREINRQGDDIKNLPSPRPS